MAGLLAPMDAYHLIRGLKAAVRVPIHLHSHYTSGMASCSALMAIMGGLDMLDTALSPLSGGTSHPPTETFVAMLGGTPYDTRLDLTMFPPIAEELRVARRKYHQFESDFAGIDCEILISQIPGGMLSNLAAQLAEQNALHQIKAVLREVRACREAHPHHYVKLSGYDSSLGRQTTALSFIVSRPSDEPGYRLDRTDGHDRVMRYRLHAYAADAPVGRRYPRVGDLTRAPRRARGAHRRELREHRRPLAGRTGERASGAGAAPGGARSRRLSRGCRRQTRRRTAVTRPSTVASSPGIGA